MSRHHPRGCAGQNRVNFYDEIINKGERVVTVVYGDRFVPVDEDRLARETESYAREQLIAEKAGAFVCASLSIVPTVRHADYIGSWLEVLREDNRAVVCSAGAASKAADLLREFVSPAIDSFVEGNEEVA